MSIMNTANSSMELEGAISDDDTAYVLISAVSQCGDVGSPGRSNDASLQIIILTTICKLKDQFTVFYYYYSKLSSKYGDCNRSQSGVCSNSAHRRRPTRLAHLYQIPRKCNYTTFACTVYT